jgi:hypothetical protein
MPFSAAACSEQAPARVLASPNPRRLASTLAPSAVRTQSKPNKKPTSWWDFCLVQGEGFEPPKAEPDDLQSPVFDRFTNPARQCECVLDRGMRYACTVVAYRSKLLHASTCTNPSPCDSGSNHIYLIFLLSSDDGSKNMEPTEGFEPTTRCLQNSRSSH